MQAAGFIRAISVYSTLAMLLQPFTALLADQLILKDGSRLNGEVVRQKDGVLEFKTGFAGVINVQWSQVSEMQADKPVEVFLDSRETLQATRILNDDGTVTIETAAESSRQVVPQELVSINPDPWERGEGYQLSGLVNAGAEFQQGNTEQEKLALDAAMKVRRLHDRLNLAAQYQKDTSNSITTAQNWLLHNKYDYFVSDQWYYGGALNFENDKFADLQLRTALGPHVGYQFYESKPLNLSVDISLMYVMEDYYFAPGNDYTALGWNVDFDKLLWQERVQLYHKQNGLLELADTGNISVNSWTGLRFPLFAGVVASTEVQVDYDGGAPSGIDEVDTVWRVKLGYQW